MGGGGGGVGAKHKPRHDIGAAASSGASKGGGTSMGGGTSTGGASKVARARAGVSRFSQRLWSQQRPHLPKSSRTAATRYSIVPMPHDLTRRSLRTARAATDIVSCGPPTGSVSRMGERPTCARRGVARRGAARRALLGGRFPQRGGAQAAVRQAGLPNVIAASSRARGAGSITPHAARAANQSNARRGLGSGGTRRHARSWVGGARV